MKRVARIVADDGDVRVEINIRLLSRNGLVTHEVRRSLQDVVRHTANLSGVQYTDFGVDNTRVEMK